MMSEEMSFDDLYPGRFYKAGNLHAPLTAKIERVYHDFELQKQNKKKSPPVVLTLAGHTREVVACKTVGVCLRELFGNDVNGWVGRTVSLYAGKVEIPGKYHGQPAIRVYGSPELTEERTIVVAFAGKPPFTVVLRATGQRHEQKKADASSRAKELSAALRAAATAEQIRQLALDVESSLAASLITREEAKALMGPIVKREKELAEKDASANVIT